MSYRDYDDMPSRRERIRGNKGSSVGIAAAICILVCLLILLICLLVSTGKDKEITQEDEILDSKANENVADSTHIDTIPIVEIQAGDEKISLEIPVDDVQDLDTIPATDGESDFEELLLTSLEKTPTEEDLNEEKADVEPVGIVEEAGAIDENTSLEEIVPIDDITLANEAHLQEDIEQITSIEELQGGDNNIDSESDILYQSDSSEEVLTELSSDEIEPIVIDVNEMNKEIPIIDEDIDSVADNIEEAIDVDSVASEDNPEIIEAPVLKTEESSIESEEERADEYIANDSSDSNKEEYELIEEIKIEKPLVIASRELDTLSVGMDLLSDNSLKITLPENIDYKSALALGMKIQRAIGYQALFKDGVISVSLDSNFGDIESIFDKLEGVIVPAFRTKR